MPHGSTRPIPTPLPPDLVDLVRAHGWELAPAGWLRRQLDDRDRLRQELEGARAAAVPRAPTPGPGERTVIGTVQPPHAEHDTPERYDRELIARHFPALPARDAVRGQRRFLHVGAGASRRLSFAKTRPARKWLICRL